MKLVFITSRNKNSNLSSLIKEINNNKSVILAFWHNRLILIPFISFYINKHSKKKHKFFALASNNKDTIFLQNVLKKFNITVILGSSKRGRKNSKGIQLKELKNIINNLNQEGVFGITPDGPIGPKYKINSKISTIARKTNTNIIPLSYSTSLYIRLNTWDKLIIPLPFSRLSFLSGDKIEASTEDENKINKKLEKEIMMITKESEKKVKNKSTF